MIQGIPNHQFFELRLILYCYASAKSVKRSLISTHQIKLVTLFQFKIVRSHPNLDSALT
jgi:hypothetical protein